MTKWLYLRNIQFLVFIFFNTQFIVTEPVNQAKNGIPSVAKGDWPDAPTVIQTFNHSSSAVAAGPLMNDMNNKLDQLMEIIQTQNCQISELRNEVAEMKKSHSNISVSAAKTTQNADLNTQKLENRLSRLIEEYLSRYEREHSKRLETFMIARYKGYFIDDFRSNELMLFDLIFAETIKFVIFVIIL